MLVAASCMVAKLTMMMARKTTPRWVSRNPGYFLSSGRNQVSACVRATAMISTYYAYDATAGAISTL
eukprot:599701-Rhodomonas_salina.1